MTFPEFQKAGFKELRIREWSDTVIGEEQSSAGAGMGQGTGSYSKNKHINIFVFCRIDILIQVRIGNFRLSTRFLEHHPVISLTVTRGVNAGFRHRIT